MNIISMSVSVCHLASNGHRPPSPLNLQKQLSLCQSQNVLIFSISLPTTIALTCCKINMNYVDLTYEFVPILPYSTISNTIHTKGS